MNLVSCGDPAYSLRRSFASEGTRPAPRDPAAMLGSKANWVPVFAGPRDKKFDEYPEESIAEWHRRLGLEG